MQLIGLNFDLSVPGGGDRPPLLRLGAEMSLNSVHLVICGAIATAITYVAITAARRRPELEEGQPEQSRARLTSA
jgi:hypothetical protein